jgi:hypothetical protein
MRDLLGYGLGMEMHALGEARRSPLNGDDRVNGSTFGIIDSSSTRFTS